MVSGAAVELPLGPVPAAAFRSVGAAVREEAEATAAGWLEQMVGGSWRWRWSRRGPGAVVADPHADLPCVVLSGAREYGGCWVPALFLMAGHRDTASYWQWATCGQRQTPKVSTEAIEGVEWVIGMLLHVVESSVKAHPE